MTDPKNQLHAAGSPTKHGGFHHDEEIRKREHFKPGATQPSPPGSSPDRFASRDTSEQRSLEIRR
jgi:hypothetical protein